MLIRLIAPILFALGSICPAAVPVVTHAGDEAIKAHRWEVIDIAFAVSESPDQPVDVEFSATFETPDRPPLEVAGFYNGGNQYILRFTANAPGVWTYKTKASIAELDGLSGKVSVGAARAGNKGGIVIPEDTPLTFRYENGESYYPIAFECDWLFALDAENADDIPVTRTFVDHLADNGFNQIVMNVFAYDVSWKKDENLQAQHEYGSPKAFPFGGNNTEPDHTRLNIDYFKRLDRVIAYLEEKGIAAHLMFYVWNKKVNWPAADSEEDNRYFDYVAKRYQAFPNIVWDISKEALGYGRNDVNYITGRIKRLREIDHYERLITVHDYSYCRRFTKQVDFISVQLWASELYGVMRKVRTDMPGKPILNIEHGGYERSPYVVFTGDYTSPEVCLERAYQCVFAGTYPTHYWQGAAWNVIIPDIAAMKPEERPRFDYYRHMRTFVDKYPIDQLIAGQKKSSSGFCLHNDRDLFIYLVPKENEHIGVRMPKKLAGQSMTGTWFDPFSGKFSEPVRKKITQWPSFAKPAGEGMRILVIEVSS